VVGWGKKWGEEQIELFNSAKENHRPKTGKKYMIIIRILMNADCYFKRDKFW
jgi:hypothetical protein